MLRYLHRRRWLTAPRIAVAVALCVYAAGVVANTVFPIFLDKPASHSPWDAALNVTPLVDYEMVDAVTNVVVFVPLGMLLPLLAVRASFGRSVAMAAAFSLAIEVAQLIDAHLLGGGHIADVNDLIFNVVGATLGLVTLAALTRIPPVDTLVERFRWR